MHKNKNNIFSIVITNIEIILIIKVVLTECRKNISISRKTSGLNIFALITSSKGITNQKVKNIIIPFTTNQPKNVINFAKIISYVSIGKVFVKYPSFP